MKEFCCEKMESHVYLKCENIILDDGDKEDKPIWYYSKLDEYCLPRPDLVGGFVSSVITITHCPWCGKKLPESKRDEWLERLRAMGINPFVGDYVPDEYMTSEWYEKADNQV